MRWIRENQQPEALIRCKADRHAAGQDLNYDEVGVVDVDGMSVAVPHAIRDARLIDQGFLCAYTLKRIDSGSCHNEHIVARSVSKANGRIEETLEYRNIVVCYPKHEAKGGCPYGAVVRGNQPLALSPLDQTCETRLRFDWATARLEPVNPDDHDLLEMVESVLKLNHDSLILQRRDAINAAGVGRGSRTPITAAEARRLAISFLEFTRGRKLAPFCVAIAQAALAHAEVIEKRSRRLRQTRRSG